MRAAPTIDSRVTFSESLGLLLEREQQRIGPEFQREEKVLNELVKAEGYKAVTYFDIDFGFMDLVLERAKGSCDHPAAIKSIVEKSFLGFLGLGNKAGELYAPCLLPACPTRSGTWVLGVYEEEKNVPGLKQLAERFSRQYGCKVDVVHFRPDRFL